MKTASKQISSASWLRMGCAGLVLAAVSVGCLGRGQTASSRRAAGSEPRRMAPAPSQFGPAPAKIVSVNPELRFVVIDFSSRVMPPAGTNLSVRRGDKTVGAVRITEPVRSRLATADIVEGEVRVGDEAR